jgi:hypothetical protein
VARESEIKKETAMTAIIGQRFGNWEVVGLDAAGRRASCGCVCGSLRVLAVEALMSGASTSCGCQPLTAPQLKALRQETAQEQRRREQRSWRPGA